MGRKTLTRLIHPDKKSLIFLLSPTNYVTNLETKIQQHFFIWFHSQQILQELVQQQINCHRSHFLLGVRNVILNDS
jgi:hypothetical protein